MAARKVVGRAVADKRGHYPTPEGVIRVVQPGEAFDLVEGGGTTSRWFTRLPESPKAKPIKAKGSEPEANDIA